MSETYKIGVTGAAGYIASRITKRLLDRGEDVVAIDNFYAPQITGKQIQGQKIRDIDIRNREGLREVFSGVDVILHLGAISGVEDCSENSELAFDVNVGGTENIAWICRENNIPLVFPCSMAIIGEPKEFPISSSHPRDPINHYGLTKAMNEQDIKQLSKDSFPAHIYIKSNLYGHHTIDGKQVDKRTVINIFVEKALNREPLTVHKPGTQARDFIHVKDVADAYLKSIDKLVDTEGFGSVTFPLASGDDRSILDIAEIVQKVVNQEMGYKPEIDLVENPRGEEAAGEDFTVDTSQAKKEIGFETKHTIEDTVREMVQ